MIREEYKQKLIGFNSTPKYKSEVDFLFNFMKPQTDERILDYGCGLGRLVLELRNKGVIAFGYDVRDLSEFPNPAIFRTDFFFQFEKIYFMHSIAHVRDVQSKIDELRDYLLPKGKVFIITPNKLWINAIKSNNYNPDTTVITHYSASELMYFFTSSGFKCNVCCQFGEVDITTGQHERIFLEFELK